MIGVSKAKQEVAVSKSELREMAAVLQAALSIDDINELGRRTGQSKRLRIVTPFRLVLALIGAMGSGRVESIADLLREFNFQNSKTTAYKAFYNRLARPAFAEFMRRVFSRLLEGLALRTLEPEAGSVLSIFEDIVIQDGSSFAIKRALRDVFPGRFTTIEPASVELHATFSGFEDNVVSVTLAPDSEAERQFLPEPEELRNKLLLADRGYPSVLYFDALSEHDASFIVRLPRGFKPWVRVVHGSGKARVPRKPVRLCQFLSQQPRCAFDLDVEFRRGRRSYFFRLVVLPRRDKWRTRLCTNLDRQRFPVELIGKLYRFRWQVELNFKEWKSYANLHRFDTANEYIVAGLIWASLCTAFLKRFLAHAAQSVGGGVPISTQRVAMCTKIVIGPLLSAVAKTLRRLASVLAETLRYLLDNAKRAHPERDQITGRLQTGLAVVGALK